MPDRDRRRRRVSFEIHSRRAALNIRADDNARADRTITAMTYLQASKIAVVTKAQLLRALKRGAAP